jgi:Zn-dependent protease
VRLLYRPPIWVFLPVISHCFAIYKYRLVAPYYHVCLILQLVEHLYFGICKQLRYYYSIMDPFQIAMIVALIISVIIHEMAHGYAASWLGDPTARLAGRLSPNPIVHLDPMMSVILPGLLIMSGSPMLFGAAKPVPYNPYNLSNQKWGEAIVAAAGPASNIVIAIIFAVLYRSADVLGLSASFLQLSFMIIVLNIFLAFFNLVPIPPLDGSKILPKFLPRAMAYKYEEFRATMEKNIGFAFVLVIIVFVLVLSKPLYSLTLTLAELLIGI